jgi:hypothetical protein
MIANDSHLTKYVRHTVTGAMGEHKPTRGAPVAWFDRAGGLPNDTEVLFYAFLVTASGEPAADILAWVLTQAS